MLTYFDDKVYGLFLTQREQQQPATKKKEIC